MRFLTDAMLGRLSRILRIFGYDTVYAIETNRILLTKDYPFYKRASKQSIFLVGEDVYDYLQQLKDELQLKFDFNMQIARCSVCNSILKPIAKKSIEDDVKPETYKHYEKFFQCTNSDCKKIYWKGSHIDDILKKLNEKIN